MLPGPWAPLARAEADAPTMLVGVAKVDVTPDYPVRLNGFGYRHRESEGVAQRIYVKALAFGADAATGGILVTVDNLGVPDAITQAVAKKLQQQLALDPARFVVTFTHTHTAPMLRGAAETIYGEVIPPAEQAHIDRYTAQMQGWLEQAALEAWKARAPARVAWNVGRVAFAVNRRRQGGPVDHDLPVLVVKDLDDRVRAIYTTYACHCVTLGHNQISGDWAGYAAAAVEAALPGAVALVSIGCGADSNPNTGVTQGDLSAAALQGKSISDEIARLLALPLRSVNGVIAAQCERVELPLVELPPRSHWEERARAPEAHVAHHARMQLARLDRGEALRTAISYPVQSWTFGDELALVFLAGEVVVDYALRLKRELDADRLWVHGYSNDFPFYIPSERVLSEGGYEGGDALLYFDMPARLAPGLEEKIVAAVHRQLAPQFAAPHAARRTGGTLPLSPERALATLRTKPGLAVELVAAEPLVVDPVAIDFGPDGRLWVAEMHDYPTGLDGNGKPGGRIRVLDDTDRDGRYDRGTIFLDDLPFPTGVTVWRDGLLVCAAPDVLFARDTDGDGRADDVQKILGGFATHNFQARVNSLQPGLDNWMYASTGLFGGQIESFAGAQADLTSRDFRFRPDTGALEPVTGQTQQSRVRDDWDNWFGCDNGTLIRHYPVVDRYLRRNPQVAPAEVAVFVPADPEPNRLFPIASHLVTFQLSGPPGYVTAACGLGIYRDSLLGDDFSGNAFICEPVSQVVHRLVLVPRGTSFAGHRAVDEQQSEFLASTDNWFRPVQARTGPDGALWVVDMYRYLIEHPMWIPPDVVATIDVRAGDDRGRIYRVRRLDQPLRPTERLDQLDDQQLARALDTLNGTRRDLIQQLLVWRQARAAVPELERLAREAAWPQVRAQALATLEGLQALTPELAAGGLADPHAGVRRQAIRLSEALADKSPTLVHKVCALVSDDDPQVRLQLAYTLGELRGKEAAAALLALARSTAGEPQLQGALLSSVSLHNAHHLLERLLADEQPEPPARLLETLVGLPEIAGDAA
ncbi:MAG: neutral/alkaline non-lysosomal ceramidase N-terminal domain-containing protein, partial [Planctomycetaceae bacterium]|nr:neutral/alkaline non-lysosomal ceramidase N-terminal domain-containing protein [Planctomycetaceae bacterium]